MTGSTKSIKLSKGKIAKMALAAILLVIIVQMIAFFLIYNFIGDMASRGQFGDMFGITNSIFSGLAAAGLVYTIFLQLGQMEHYKEESLRAKDEFNQGVELTKASVLLAKQQLSASAEAQRLNAAIALLKYFEQRFDFLEELDGRGMGPANIDQHKVDLAKKNVKLREILNEVYGVVVSEEV